MPRQPRHALMGILAQRVITAVGQVPLALELLLIAPVILTVNVKQVLTCLLCNAWFVVFVLKIFSKTDSS